MLKKVPLYILLATLFAVQVIGVVTTIGYLSWHHEKIAVRRLADEWMIAINDRVDQHIREFVDRAQEFNQTNAAAFESGILDFRDFDAVGRYFHRQCQLFNFTYMNFGWQDGAFIGAGYGFESDKLDISEVSPLNPSELRGYATDEQGNRLTVIAEVENPQVTQSPWYAETVAAGQSIWSSVYGWSNVPNRTRISANTPIYDEHQSLLGVLGIDIELSQISQFLQQIQGDRPGSVFILERSGQLIASSDDATLVQTVDEKATRPNISQRQHSDIPSILQALTHHYSSLQAITKPEILHVSLPGAPFVGVRPIQDDYGLDWLVVTAVPEAEFLGEIHASVTRTVALCGLAVLISLAVSLWTAELVTHALVRLTQATQDFAAGSRSVSLPACMHIKEIATLSESFIRMMDSVRDAEQLRETYAQTLERQVAEKTAELQKTAAQLQEAQRIARVGSWEFDVCTQQTTWSAELFRIAGMAPTHSGKVDFNVPDVVHSDDRGALMQAVETAIAEKIPYEVEHRIVSPSGNIRHVVSRGEAICDEQGNVVGLAGTAADITERIRIEQELQESETRLKLALEASHAAAWVLDLKADKVVTTGTIAPSLEVQNLSHEEAMKMVHPDDLESVKSVTQAALAQPGEYQVDHRMFVPGSSECRWIQVNGKVLTDTTGQPSRIVGLSIDITERKRLEQELVKTRDFRELLFDESNDALFLVDSGTRQIVDCNLRAVQVFEAEGKQDLVGMRGYQLRRHPIAPEELIEIRDSLSHRGCWRREIEYKTLKEKKCWGDLSIRRITFDEAVFDFVRVTDITARKESELALQASEAKYRQIVETMSEGIWAVDAHSQTTYVNQSMAQMFGYTTDEMLGRSVLEFMDEANQEIAINIIERRRQGISENYDFQFRHRDGHAIWTIVSTQPIYDESGEYRGAFGMLTDISDRKHLELALQTSEQKLSDILDSVVAAIITFRLYPDGSIQHDYISPRCREIYGYTAAELLADSDLWRSRVHQDDLQNTIDPACQAVLQSSSSTTRIIEYRFRRKDGSICWVLGSAFFRWDDTAGCWQVTVVDTDITEQKSLEQALQDSETTLNHILDSLGAAVTRIWVDENQDWAFDYLSEGFGRLYGYSTDDIAADKTLWFRGILPEHWETVMLPSFPKIFREEPHHLEFVFNHPDGTQRWISQYCTSQQDEAHGRWLVTSIAIDISDRKQSERALQAREAQFQRLANNIVGMLYQYVLRADGSEGYTYVSPKCRDIYEYEPQELLQNFGIVSAMVHPDDVEPISQANLASAQTLESLDVEFRLLPPSGKVRWIRAASHPQRQSNGDIVWDGLAIDITARKQIEHDLRQREAESRAILAAIPDLMIRVGADGVYREIISPQPEIDIFPSSDDYVGLNMRDLLPEDLAAQEMHYLKQALITGDVQTFEQQVQASKRFQYEEVRVVKSGQDEVLCMVRDITKRKQAEIALHNVTQEVAEWAERYATAAHTSGQILFEYDLETDRDTWGPNTEAVLGYSDSAMPSGKQQFFEHIHPDDQDLIHQVYRCDHIRSEPYRVEFRFRHAEGHYCWIEERGMTRYNAEGTAVQVIGYLKDISDRKQAELALKTNEARYRGIFDQVAVGINQADCSGRFISANQAFCDMVGYTEAEILNLTYQDITHPEDLALHQSPYEQLIAGKIPSYLHEKRYLHKAGHDVWVQINMSPLRDGEGRVISDTAVVVNIEDRKRAEAALRQSEHTNRTIVETIPDLLIRMDCQGQYSHLVSSENALSNYAFPTDASENQNILSPELYERRLHYARQAFASNSLQVYEQAFESDQTLRYEEVRIASLNEQEVLVMVRDITDRKQIEQQLQKLNQELEARVEERTTALQEREARYRALVDVLPDLLIRMNREGVYLDIVTDESIQVFNPTQFRVGASIYDVLPPKRAQERMFAVQQALETQKIQTEIYELVLDGQTQFEEARVIAINKDEVLVIVRDISDRIRAQEALRRSEERWQFALEGSGDGVWDWHPLINQVFYSERWKAMLGYTDTEPGNTLSDWSNLVHPDDIVQCYADIAQHCRGETDIYQNEHRLRCKDGSYKWILDRGKVIKWTAKQQPLRMIGTTTDITARKLAEKKIREQAALLDIASDAILVEELNQQIHYWNQGAERLYGWQATEVMGQNASVLFRQNPSQTQKAMHTLLSCGKWQGELNKITKAGRLVTVQSRWTLARNEAGQPKFILSVDTDITEKKKLEAKFYQAQRLDSLGKLSSGIAHDLNNVLTPILGMSQLLRLNQQGLSDEGKEYVELIESSAKRGSDLVRQVLTFARGSDGERTLVDVVALVQEVIDVVQQSFSRAIEIRQSVVPQAESPTSLVSTVYADATHLHQVLMNLVINARDAMPDGGVLTLAIENIAVDEGAARNNWNARVGNYVVLTISDTGSGIDPEILDRIFEPFFTTKKVGKGTGLGLSTSLGIVKNYGGFMQIASEIDCGTQVHVYLPVSDINASERRSTTELFEGNGELILIVEDEDTAQRSIRLFVENYHYETLIARDGVEAIALYDQYKSEISVVITDIMMPNLGGISLIERIRKMSPTAKILAVSGLSANQSSALAAGADVFLTKPYTLEDLLMNIRNLADESIRDLD